MCGCVGVCTCIEICVCVLLIVLHECWLHWGMLTHTGALVSSIDECGDPIVMYYIMHMYHTPLMADIDILTC